MQRRFYDIHCHAMNLSHPNFLAFIKCFEKPFFDNTDKFLKSHRLITFFAANYLLLKFLLFKPFNLKNLMDILKKAGNEDLPDKFMNLIAAMENDVGSYFIMMEECIKEHVMEDRKITIGGNSYDKIVLTPLLMDFGNDRTYYENLHYNKKPVRMPIVEQIIDVFNGIKRYKEKTPYGLFEIYPFMGINTRNYTLNKLQDMLDMCFGEYEGKREGLLSHMGNFNGDPHTIKSNTYAGIKLYPPLGFDPWPYGRGEREKVELLYHFCEKMQIPVTVHCSDEGFDSEGARDMEEVTSPLKWARVLENHPSLKLNLAHFGRLKSSDDKWEKEILKLIGEYDNVYTDISYRGFDDGSYKALKDAFGSIKDEGFKNKLMSRILYGTDFMINLIKTGSYCEYTNLFIKTQHFSSEEKDTFCSVNPEKYLFKE